MKVKLSVILIIMVASIQNVSGEESKDRYLQYPYVSSISLKQEADADLFNQYAELAVEFVSALNLRTPMSELDSLFLTEANEDAYLAARYEGYDDLNDEDREDETARSKALILDNKDYWSQITVQNSEDEFTFVLIDYGVYIDFETSYYFLLSMEIEPGSMKGKVPLLAEYINGKLHVSGLGIEPFFF